MRHILLDSSPLGLLAKPGNNSEVIAITDWAMASLAAGHEIYVPEVVDYELRRELLRAGKTVRHPEIRWLEKPISLFAAQHGRNAQGSRSMGTGETERIFNRRSQQTRHRRHPCGSGIDAECTRDRNTGRNQQHRPSFAVRAFGFMAEHRAIIILNGIGEVHRALYYRSATSDSCS